MVETCLNIESNIAIPDFAFLAMFGHFRPQSVGMGLFLIFFLGFLEQNRGSLKKKTTFTGCSPGYMAPSTPQEEWKSLRSQSLRMALQRALKHFAGPLVELEAGVVVRSPKIPRQKARSRHHVQQEIKEHHQTTPKKPTKKRSFKKNIQEAQQKEKTKKYTPKSTSSHQ